MPGQKWPDESALSTSIKPLLAPDTKRRAVSVKIVEKWISDNEKDLSTAMWLVLERTDQWRMQDFSKGGSVVT